jgi:hypothetical protein
MTNPCGPDADGDEVPHGPGPCLNDPSDNGRPPDDVKELPFNLYGDYAAWEMTVTGLGPEDTRVFRLSTEAPGDSRTVTRKLRKGNAYRLAMTAWLGSGEHTDPDWYCWQARIDGQPSQRTYDSYDSARIPGAAATVSGDGWFADNADGLLTSHVHMCDGYGGNVAEGLEAVLYVPKIVTETVATSPADRSRKTIGVGEEVRLSLLPADIGTVTWSIRSGSGQLSHHMGDSVTFTAPAYADTATVTASAGGGECEVEFEVIEPSGFIFENIDVSSDPYSETHWPIPTENWLLLKYHADMYLQPDTVNFYRVRLYEGASDPYATGYFTLYRHGMQPHKPNGPHPMEDNVVVAGKGTRCKHSDEITGIVELDIGTAGGDLYWVLQWEYDIEGGTRKDLKLIVQNNNIKWNGEQVFTVVKDASGYWVSPSAPYPNPVGE